MDKPFKAFEREVAKLIGGKRFPANSGAELDCEGPTMVAQCKEVSRLSLEELTQLAEMVERQGQAKGKIGLVGVKVRRGAGHPSPGLVVMTFEQFTTLTMWLGWRESRDGPARPAPEMPVDAEEARLPGDRFSIFP